MRFGVLGTGMVGQTLASKLVELGHEVMMGSREAANQKAADWAAAAGGGAQSGTFADAAAFGEVVINATAGTASLAALDLAGQQNLAGKVLVDVANALDFSRGMPPSLALETTDSLGEQIQRQYPETRVVKALNTMTAPLMVNPAALSGTHDVFICGNDGEAKNTVARLLESFGWRQDQIRDLGDISGARGTEAFLVLWLRLFQTQQTPIFNIGIVGA
jgi:8-hydroxy-5-deazaflavin:NADPH oxidoreductase